MKTRIIIICILLVCSGYNYAQKLGSLLDKEISLNFQNEKTIRILERIEQLGAFHFSYPSDLIHPNKELSIQVKNKTIRECLYILFKKEISFKQKGKYIILQKAKEPKADRIIIKGYVSDQQSGKKIARASVYDKQTLASTTSNDFGYYEIEIPGNKTPEITINKEAYQDTSVQLNQVEDLQNIGIKPMDTTRYKRDSAELVQALKDVKKLGQEIWHETKSLVHSLNIRDTFFRSSQVSFLPYLGTNGALSAHVINNYSFNIIGGISKGVRVLELGLILNLVNGNVEGIQVAGIGNLVNGQMNGIQVAGIQNLNRRQVKGLQFSGAINVNLDTLKGAQFSGIMNINPTVIIGPQFAGLGNINQQHLQGPAFAGLFNISQYDESKLRMAGLFNLCNHGTKSAEFAGLFNYSSYSITHVKYAGLFNANRDSSSSICFAGVFNYTPRYTGNFKAAGFMNIGDNVNATTELAGFMNLNRGINKGVQIAGFMNICKENDGIQLAPFNFSKDAVGLPIGVLSFVQHGMHQLEYSRNENQFNEFRFRTGVKKLNNEIIIGFQNWNTDAQKWYLGYGINTGIRLNNKFSLDLGLSCVQINDQKWNTHVSLLNKFQSDIELRLANTLALFMGPTLNVFVLNDYSSQYESMKAIVPSKTWINNENNKGIHAIAWFGWRAGIRFF
ncbi:MAG: hypothetical protein ACOVP1_01290 [Bacteroidia bacterium]